MATASGARSPSNGLAARCRTSTLACRVLSPARAWAASHTPHIPSHPTSRSTRWRRGPRGRRPSSPPSSPRWRASSRRPSAPFSTIQCSSRSSTGCCWSLRGGVELQGGGRGGCGGAAARQLPSGGSGATPARLSGFGGAVLVAFRGQHARRCMRKKLPCSSAFFSRYVHVCACALRVFDSLNCPVHEGMRGVAGPWRFVPS